MFGNNFWKTLGHKRLEVIVGSAVAYTDDTTYEAFIANAVEGEIGFFNAATGATITGAIGATTRFFLALKRGGRVHKTTPSLGSEVTKEKVAYVAPVKQISTIAFGTRASLVVQDLTFTARAGGTGGNSITITFVDPAGNNAALSIGVVGTDITVNLATDGASAPTSTAAQVAVALKASAAAMALVDVQVSGTATDVQAAAAQTALANGAAATAPTAGDIYPIQITDLTTAAQPFPTYQYEYVAKTGDTIQTVITALAAQINSTTSFANRDSDLIVDATAGTGQLRLIAKDYGTSFSVQLREDMVAIGTVTHEAKMKLGSGYYEQVLAMEQAGDIFSGVTTNYPENHATPAEFGAPPSLVSASNTYNMYQWTKVPWEASRTPHNVWSPGTRYFALAVPSNDTNPSASVDTILGV